MKSVKLSNVVLLLLTALFLMPPVAAAEPARAKLVLEIVVDQLRGDMPGLAMDRCGPGRFRHLAQNGVWYDNAHHPHANTETIVGHVTLATGAYPSRHGMVGNVWVDAEKDRLVYNIEDPDYAATGSSQ
ncbi:MAG: alkaline phosphatase family protein [Planctomycetota bacterium]|jgi:predicted AlkP superfamily pyrophosphatase or phosphodiesterase